MFSQLRGLFAQIKSVFNFKVAARQQKQV